MWGQDAFTTRVLVNTSEVGAFDQARVRLVDSELATSDVVLADIDDVPMLESGDGCDRDGVENLCPDGEVCARSANPTYRCVVSTAPSLDSVTLYETVDGDSRFWAIEADGRDRDYDAAGLRIDILDVDDTPIVEDHPSEFDAVEWNGDRFTGHFVVSLPADLEYAVIQLRAYDQGGASSEEMVAEPEPPPLLSRGDACDRRGRFGVCRAGDLCFEEVVLGGEGLTCRRESSACAADVPVIDLNGFQRGARWIASAHNASWPLDSVGSCGSASSTVIFRFDAAVAGRYVFTTASAAEGADTILSARTACRAEATELACNDDRADGDLLSEVSVALNANERVYLLAAGYGSWTGLFTLTAERR